jgi:hypothetical protein
MEYFALSLVCFVLAMVVMLFQKLFGKSSRGSYTPQVVGGRKAEIQRRGSDGRWVGVIRCSYKDAGWRTDHLASQNIPGTVRAIDADTGQIIG